MTCQTRKLATPLSVRAMASGASGNIPFWNSIFENLFSRRYACFWDSTNWSGVEAMKLRCDRCYLGRTENVGDTKHDVVCPSPFDKRAQLVLDILNLLSGESRDGIISSITLTQLAMAILAIPNFCLYSVFGARRWSKSNCNDCQLKNKPKLGGLFKIASTRMN